MSLNRALVEFYISYKLSQRNFPLDHLGLSEPAARGSDSELLGRTEGRTETRTEALEPGSDRTEALTEAQTEARTEARTEGLDSDVVCSVNGGSSLSDSASASPLLSASAPEDPAAPSDPAPPSDPLPLIKEALRDSALEFELRFALAFSDLHRQLHLTPGSAYRSFESVMDEVFRDGVNWGRVVGLFAFGGALAVECVDKEMSGLVDKIMDWMTVYLDNHIQEWINEQGGWTRFADLYGSDAAAESRRSQESVRRWFWAGATLVTGVVLGSLLASKRL